MNININNLLNTEFTWDNRKSILEFLSHKDKVRFALFCANQVKHLIEDTRSLKALKIVELFLEDKATSEDCRKAADAAYTAHTAANAAAYTAYTAANAAAYTAAHAASYVAHAATYAAAYAADATYADSSSAKQEQIEYLRQLVIDSLPEEHKDNWLLVASI